MARALELRRSATQGKPPLDRRQGRWLRADCVENWRCGPLDVFEVLAEELRVAAIQTDVVPCGSACSHADCAAHDKGDGLGLSFAEALRHAAAALFRVHHLMSELMPWSRKLLSRRLAGAVK
jgi:hypothetical protein